MAEPGQPEFRINTAKYRQDIERFTRDTGQEASVFFREMFRMLIELCYHYTAPPSKGAGSQGGPAAARAAGVASIRSDFGKTIRSYSLTYIEMLRRIAGGSYIESLTLTSKSGTPYTLSRIHLDPSGQRIDQYHDSRRNSRGRVPGKPSPGEWKYNKMYTTMQARTRALNARIKRVGKLKSGWGPSLAGSGSRLPHAWVRKASMIPGKSGAVGGDYRQESATEDFKGRFIGINYASYFRGSADVIRRASQIQERAAERYFSLWIDRHIKKHNQMAVAGSGGTA